MYKLISSLILLLVLEIIAECTPRHHTPHTVATHRRSHFTLHTRTAVCYRANFNANRLSISTTRGTGDGKSTSPASYNSPFSFLGLIQRKHMVPCVCPAVLNQVVPGTCGSWCATIMRTFCLALSTYVARPLLV